jgi:hypothetical protein
LKKVRKRFGVNKNFATFAPALSTTFERLKHTNAFKKSAPYYIGEAKFFKKAF